MMVSSLWRALLTALGLVAAGMVSSAGCVSGVEGEEPAGRGRAPSASGGEGGQSDDSKGDAGFAGYAHPEGGGEKGGAGGGGNAAGGKGGGGKAGGGASDITAAGGSVAGSAGADATGTGGSVAAPPKTECEPGKSEQVGICGNCGENVRTCGAEGKWGAPSCTGQGVCKPGVVEKEPCGNCGDKTRTCTSACVWPAFTACKGEGACKPGDTRNDPSCDGCEHVTCGAACSWGSTCKLDAGAECAYEKGSHFRCCGNDKWQFCSSSCVFYACEACGSSCASTCN